MKIFLQHFLPAVLVVTSICLFSTVNVYAQFPSTGGTYTIDTTLTNTFAGSNNGNFKSFKRAISALNATTAGSIANGVTFNVAAGESFFELPSTITYANLNAATPPIIFQNSGTPGTNNPLLYGTSGGGNADYIIQVKGGSYYTFNGINFFDNPINNTPNLYMEAGLYFTANVAGTLGSTYNTVENCTVSLNLSNTNATACIEVNNVSGSNWAVSDNYNSFYNNTVQNASYGYYLTNTNGLSDNGNIIGTQNGGISTVQNFSLNGIYVVTQNNIKVFNTTITNAAYTTGTTQEVGIYYSTGSVYADYGQFIGNNINNLSTSAGAYGIRVMSSIANSDIFSNTISNISSSSNGSGDVKGIEVNSGNTNIYYNSISNILHPIASNGFDGAGIALGNGTGTSTAPVNCNTVNIIGNTVNNLDAIATSHGSSTFQNEIAGILLTPSNLVSPVMNVSNNIVSNVTSSVTASANGAITSGIRVKSGGTDGIPGCVFSNNTVHDISSSGGAETAGISVANLYNPSISNNNIYTVYNNSTNTTSGANFDGINIVCAASTAYNNFVSDIRANLSASNVYGIAINASGAHKIYYNSVYLNGVSSSGTTGGISAALYSVAITLGGGLDYRNNILINNYNLTTSAAAAKNVAFYYVPSTAHDYSGLSTGANNNLLYAGGSISKNFTFWDNTTTYATLANYQAQMLIAPVNSSREVSATTFVVNADATLFNQIAALPYDLHLQAGATDAINKGTVNLGSSFTTDFDGDLRPTGSTQTTIGADEVANCPANAPATAGAIVGTSSVCPGASSVSYSIPVVANAGGYTWTVPAGATIVSGVNTNSIAVTYPVSVVAGNVTVAATNGCGAGTSSSLAITVNPILSAPTAIVGTATVCQGENNIAYSVPVVSGAVSYNWILPNGAAIAGSSNTNSIVVNYSGSAASGNLLVSAVNTCGIASTNSTLPITVNLLPSLATVTGSNSICQSQSGIAYTALMTNTNTYNWAVTGTGAIIASGTGTNNITVNFAANAASGNITIYGTNACGTGPTSTLSYTTTSVPPFAAASITGTSAFCQGSTITYSVAPITLAANYNWTLPAGAAIVGTSTGNAVAVNFTTGAVSGNITVAGSNGCGVGTSSSFPITVNPIPVPASAISGPNAICVQGSYNYSIPLVTNATGYTWTLPTGASITAGSNTNNVTIKFTSTGSGSILVDGTNTCGTGTAAGLGETVAANPNITTTPTSGTSCSGSGVSVTASGGATYVWSPSGFLSDTTTATVIASPTITTTYTVIGTVVAGCSTAKTIVITGQPSLNGYYIIDNTISGAANLFPNTNVFNSFASAATAVNTCVSGPVTFTVMDDESFVEQRIVFTFNNTGAFPIVFQRSNTGTLNPVVYPVAGTGTTDYIVQMQGASYFTFNGIYFRDTSTNTTSTTEMEDAFYLTTGNGLGSTNNTIMNCNLRLNNTNSTYGIRTVVSSGSAVTNSNNSFYNNTISNVTDGYSFENGSNSTSNPPDNNNVVGTINGGTSSVTNFTQKGVNALTQNNLKVFNTTISNNGYAASNNQFYGIELSYGFTATSTTQYAQFYGNNINNIGSTTNTVYGIYLNASLYSTDIYSNTITNLTTANSGGNTEIIGIRVGSGNANINYNYINGITHPNSGSIYDQSGISIGSGQVGPTTCNTVNIIGNTVSNITSNNQSTGVNVFFNEIGGILITPSSATTPVMNVSYNNVSNIQNTSTGAVQISGICVKEANAAGTAYAIPNCVFSNNIIHNVSASGGRDMRGLSVVGCTSTQIFNNLVYSIFSTGTNSNPVSGIEDGCTSASNSTNCYIYNNMVFDIRATSGSFSTLPNVDGIGVFTPSNTSATVTVNGTHQVYYNSVYLDASQASATTAKTTAFYSSALTLSGTETGLDYRNNIFINNTNLSSAAATARAYAFWYNSSASGYPGILASATVSNNPNNNLLYAGTPGTQHIIFYNGTTEYQNLTGSPGYQNQMQAAGGNAANRETAVTTLSANTPSTLFTNVSALPYDLHLQNPGATDAIGKGTLNLSSFYTTDFDGDARATGSNPTTIGADEPDNCPANAAGAAGTITGTATVCPGQAGVTYSVAAITNVPAGNYVWTLPTGATITSGSGTNTIIVNFTSPASSGNVTVYGFNGCGNGASSSFAVTVNAVPGAAGAITGASPDCQSQTGVSFSVGAISGATSYNWTLPSGYTISSGSNTNSVGVDFSNSVVDGYITVSGTNACGTGSVSAPFAVAVSPLPGTGAITGTSSICFGQTDISYSVAMTNTSGYIWTAPPGATISSGAGTNAITIDYTGSASSGNVTVFGFNTCGNGPIASFPVIVNAAVPATPGIITGTTPLCQNINNVAYSVAAVSGATGYNWTVPTGTTIVSATNSSINVNFSSLAVSGNVTVSGVNGCGTGPSSSYPVTINPIPVAASAIVGPAAVCKNTSAVYSVAAIANATGYNWTISGSLGTVTSGVNTNMVTISFTNTGSGTITVLGTNSCANGISSLIAVSVSSIPTITTSPSGNTVACGGGSVNLTAAGGATYAWNPVAGLSNVTGATVAASPSVTTTYTVIGSAAGGCSSTASVAVIAYPGLSGNYTIDNSVSAPGSLFPNTNVFNSFTSAALAISCANGPVTFTVNDNETFAEPPVFISYSNPNAYPIVFERSNTGANMPVLYGTNGTINSGQVGDAVLTLKGSSYFTFNGITFADNPANSNAAQKMEVGIYLTSASTPVAGCSNNTFINCQVSLDPTLTYSSSSPVPGPFGVHVINPAANTTVSNNNNLFYNNNIQNVYIGYYFDNQTTSGILDNGNQIGTTAGGTSIINNVIGISSLTGASGVGAAGVVGRGQDNFQVFNTSITNVTCLNNAAVGIDYWTSYSTAPKGTGTFYGNYIANITSSTNGGAFGFVSGVAGSSVLQSNLYGNTITNLTSNSNDVLGISIQAGNANISNNLVTNLQHPIAQSGYEGAGIHIGSDASGGNSSVTSANIFGNTVSNLSFNATSSGTFEIGGIVVSPTGSNNTPVVTVSNNNVSYIQNLSTERTVGFDMKSASGNIPNCIINNNIFHDISCTGTNVVGISIQQPMTTPKIYGNYIYAIYDPSTTGSSIYGILNSMISTTSARIYNNMIYDIHSSNSASSIIGIGLTTAAIDTLLYNTIYLNPTAPSGTPTYIGLYANGAPASGLLYSNNIIINNANMSASSGKAYAFNFNSTTMTQLNSNSNNNLLYAGTTSGSQNYIFYTGSSGASYQNLSAYQAAVSPRDAAAHTLTVLPSALFVSANNSPYNVHLNTSGTITDVAGEGTLNLSSHYTTDIDGDLRATGSNPTTIGADEVCGSGVPSAPGAITGPTSICQGTTSATYSVPAIANAGSYVWSVPAGATITSGLSTNTITVSFEPPATSGNVTVQGTNGCGTGTSSSLAVSLSTVPSTPGTIAGSANICAGQNGVAYSVPLVGGATGYNWTFPSGGSIASGSNTNSILVNFSNSTSNGGLVVTAFNSCGSGPSSAPFVVTVKPAPTVTVGPNSNTVCAGTKVVLTGSGANSYSWSPSTGLDAVVGTAVDATPLTNTTYTVVGTGTNSCTASAITSFAVNTVPTLSVSPPSAVCTGQISQVISASGNAVSYTWSPTTNLSPSAGTSATETAQISELTFYTVTGVGANNCSASAVVPVATVATGGMVTPAFSIICSGSSNTLTATGAAGKNYEWEISTDNVNWTAISGATNTTYSTNPADGSSLKYYRLLSQSDACWDVASTTAIVDVSNSAITITPTSVTDVSLTLNWSPVGSGNYSISYTGPTSATLTSVTPPKTLTGLVPNGTYSITVTQTGAGLGTCPATGTITGVTTLCAMPTGVTVSSPAPSQIQVNWTGVAGADYRVYYRPLFSYNTYFTKDVSNASSVLLTKQGGNNLYASTTYEVYVSRLDCPTTGAIGQGTNPANITTLPTVICATPQIDSVRSLCPVQIEVFIHDNGVNQYNVFIQRITPSILAVNSYGVSGTYFTINTPYSGDQYLIAVEAKCGSAISSLYVYPGNITVKPLCNAPTNLVLSNPTCHGFTASWNADQCLSNLASGYDFYLRVAGTINYNSYGVALPGSGIGPHDLLNFLTTGRTYQVFVRSVYSCNGFVTYGPSSQIETITTLSSGCREEDAEQPQENKPATQQYSPDNNEVFSLYPNPNTGKFIVDLSRLNMEEDAVRIEVVNMLGQTVLTHLTIISDGYMSEYINLPNDASPGAYIVRLTAGKNVYTAKMIISK